MICISVLVIYLSLFVTLFRALKVIGFKMPLNKEEDRTFSHSSLKSLFNLSLFYLSGSK